MMNEEHLKIHTYLLSTGFIPADARNHAAIYNFNADNLLYEKTACLFVTWSDEYNTLYRVIGGFLCTANFYPDGEFAFLVTHPAAQSVTSDDLLYVVDTLYDISVAAGFKTLYIREIEERFMEDYRQLPNYHIKEEYDENLSEYVYSADSLLDLNGKVNEEKRRQLRKFADKPNVTLQTITPENISLCLGIERQWCESQDCGICRSFVGCAKKTPEIMIDIFDGCVYQGLFGYIDDVLSGYILFEKVSGDAAYFYFAKTTVSNFSIYLYYNAIQRYMQNVKRINLGADLGIQGLRLFKRRLGPYELQKKYLCTFTKK